MENINKQLVETIQSLNKELEYIIITGSYVYNQKNARYADIVIVSKQPISEELNEKLLDLGCDEIFYHNELEDIAYSANYYLAFNIVLMGDKDKLYSCLKEKVDPRALIGDFVRDLKESTECLFLLLKPGDEAGGSQVLPKVFDYLFLAARDCVINILVRNRLLDVNYNLPKDDMDKFISIVDTCHIKYGINMEFTADSMQGIFDEYQEFHGKVLELLLDDYY